MRFIGDLPGEIIDLRLDEVSELCLKAAKTGVGGANIEEAADDDDPLASPKSTACDVGCEFIMLCWCMNIVDDDTEGLEL